LDARVSGLKRRGMRSCAGQRKVRFAIALFALAPTLIGIARVEAGEVPDPVAIVTDISGKVDTQVEKTVVQAALLTAFLEGSRARLQAGARMVVLYLSAGDQFEIKGPALVRFAPQAPESLSGTEPVRLRPAVGKDGKSIRIRPVGVTPAALVVRGGVHKPIRTLSPTGPLTLERAPQFRWEPAEPGLEYRFALKDDRGNTVFAQRVLGEALQLPADVVLAAGARYRWSVGTRSPAGQQYAAEQAFAVADADTRAAMDNYRPAANAPLHEQVTFAVWLDQTGLREEASAQWKKIADSGGPVPAGR
jgi:hypothetical protein